MRRFDIGGGGLCTCGFALGLPLHQHMHPAGEGVDFAALTRDHIRQILKRADQMRRALFETVQPVHFRDPLLAEPAPKR